MASHRLFSTVLFSIIISASLLLAIGLILAVLGFALPGPAARTRTEDVTVTKEKNEDGVTHKVASERHVRHS